MWFINKVLLVVFVLFIWITGLCAATGSAEGDVLAIDIKEAGNIALKNSPDIKIAKERINQAREAYNIAKARYFPEVNLNCSAVNNRVSHVTFKKNKSLASLSGADIDNPEMYYNAGVSVFWVLFNGFGRKYDSEKQDSFVNMRNFSHIDAQRVVLSMVSQAYFAAQLFRENIDIAKADVVFYRRQLEDATARNIGGTGSLSDVINFQVRVHSAEAEIINARYEYYSAMSVLAALLGYKSAEFPVGTGLVRFNYKDAEQFIVPHIGILIEQALENRPDIRKYKYSLNMAEAAIKVEKARFFPVIWIEGSTSGQREGDAELGHNDIENMASLNVSCNLFAGGAYRAAYRRAKALARETERRLDRLKIQITSDIKQSYAELESAIQRYTLYKNNASLVKQNRELVEMEYGAGKCSLVRLNEAQRDYSTTISRMALAFVSTCQAKFRLDADTGMILDQF